MKITIPNGIKTIGQNTANMAREVGDATLKCAGVVKQKADEFISSKPALKKVSKEHVIGAGVLLGALALTVSFIKGLKKNVDDEVKK